MLPAREILISSCLGLLLGCVTGRPDFKIIKNIPQRLPTSLTTLTCTPVSTAVATPTPVSPLLAQAITYSVQPHDTLWWICQRFLGDPQAYVGVAKQNQISNPDLIYPGQRLLINPPVVPKPSFSATSSLRNITAYPTKTISPTPEPTPVVFPHRQNQAFAPGEKLVFSVEYFSIAAGFATLEVQPGPMMHQRPTLHLVAQAWTHPAFEWLFIVRDKIESYIDAQGLFAWKYEKHLREGSYSNDAELIYDQKRRKVIKDQGKKEVDAPAWTQDVLSEFYFFRTLDMQVGDEISIPVVADDGKSYTLIVKVLRQEKVTVPAGSFNCLVVEPYLKFESVFRHQGQLHVWLTADKRKVPVLVKSRIVIGTIDIVLRDAVVVEVE